MKKKRKSRFMLVLFLLIIVIALIYFIYGRLKPGGESAPAGEIPGILEEEGSLLVEGFGIDLYHVFDWNADDEVNFTCTGKELSLPAGKYRVRLHGQSLDVTITANQRSVVKCGLLTVSGSGEALYEVWDKDDQKKLDFKSTGSFFELFPDQYVVRLRNISQQVSISAGDTTVISTGILDVRGDSRDLYYVYDETGQNRMDFTRVGKPIELLPGMYRIKIRDRIVRVEVKSGGTALVEVN